MSRNDKMKFIRFIEGSELCISDALAKLMYREVPITAGSENFAIKE